MRHEDLGIGEADRKDLDGAGGSYTQAPEYSFAFLGMPLLDSAVDILMVQSLWLLSTPIKI